MEITRLLEILEKLKILIEEDSLEYAKDYIELEISNLRSLSKKD